MKLCAGATLQVDRALGIPELSLVLRPGQRRTGNSSRVSGVYFVTGHGGRAAVLSATDETSPNRRRCRGARVAARESDCTEGHCRSAADLGTRTACSLRHVGGKKAARVEAAGEGAEL